MAGVIEYIGVEKSDYGMLLNSNRNLKVYVEGKNDKRIYKEVFGYNVDVLNPQEVNEIYRPGKSSVVAIVKNEGKSEAIGIIDADFDIICNRLEDDDRLFYTDAHDLETMLLADIKYVDISEEYISKIIETQYSTKKRKIKTIREDIIDIKNIAYTIGCIKYNSEKSKKYKFRFKVDLLKTTKEMDTYQDNKRVKNSENGMYYKYFYYETRSESSRIHFDVDTYLRDLDEKIEKGKINEIKNIIREYKDLEDKIQIYNGHDVANIITAFIDARMEKVVNVEDLIINVCWNKYAFLLTKLSNKLFEFEKANEETFGEVIREDMREIRRRFVGMS